MWLADLTRLRPAYDAWNADIKRARAEHDEHPLAICLGIRRSDGEERPCWNVRIAGLFCRHCATDADAAARRMAARPLRPCVRCGREQRAKTCSTCTMRASRARKAGAS